MNPNPVARPAKPVNNPSCQSDPIWTDPTTTRLLYNPIRYEPEHKKIWPEPIRYILNPIRPVSQMNPFQPEFYESSLTRSVDPIWHP